MILFIFFSRLFSLVVYLFIFKIIVKHNNYQHNFKSIEEHENRQESTVKQEEQIRLKKRRRDKYSMAQN
jgi:hypothetical protein